MLMRYWAGEHGLWSVVRVPNVEDQGAHRLHRELESLKKERTRHRNRIRDLLVAQGPAPGDFFQCLEMLTLWDGTSSSGTYNVLQPAIAAQLRDRKIANVPRTGADAVATGNVGCIS